MFSDFVYGGGWIRKLRGDYLNKNKGVD